MNKVVVTGGAGYIGSHACKALKKKGFIPITIDNLSRGNSEAVKWGDLIVSDLKDIEKTNQIIKSINPIAVMHFAGKAYVEESIINPSEYSLDNISGTLSLLNACKNNNVKNFIFSSSCATYGVTKSSEIITESYPQNPVNPYGLTKLYCEKLIGEFCKAYDIRSVIFRYFNAAGADPDCDIGEKHQPETHLIPNLINAALNNKEFKLFGIDYDTSDGTAVRDFIHVVDIALAHTAALEYIFNKPYGYCESFNLGSGTPFSIKDLISKVELITGESIKIQVMSRREGDPPFLACCFKKAKKEFGFIPVNSSIDNVITSACNWHKK